MDNLFTISTSPIVIAGPCSVENSSQLCSTVEALSRDSRIAMIRCGVWKPRTHPGGFEGLGEPALHWISDLKRQHPHLHFCCEVARPEHIEMCQRYGIEAVWIGARTSVNPFAMGELAAALRGSAMAVMVKNPIIPDIELWVGAIERIQQAGIEDLAAIHRGFSTYNNYSYRNNPLWEIPIELKRRMPTLPLLCDPSHIGGRRDLVAPISQMALDLHFDGLMVEVHNDPDNALTDSQQQITPEQFGQMLDKLKQRHDSETAPSELQRLRDHLDVIDQQLLKLLSQRMEISRQIGAIKHQNNMPIFQPQRWEQVLAQQQKAGAALGLDDHFVKEIAEKIHRESLRMQEEIQ